MVDLEELVTKPRRQASSLQELAPWFGFLEEDQMILCTDGSLVAGFRFDGLPWEGITDDELNAQIEMLQRSFRGMGERITIWSYVDRRYVHEYDHAEFVNPVARQIDEAWADSIMNRRNASLRHEVFVGYRADAGSFALIDAIASEMENGANIFGAIGKVLLRDVASSATVGRIRGRLHEMVNDFRQAISSFHGVVGPRLGFERLENEYLLGALSARFNLASPPGPVNIPNRLTYLAQSLPADTLVRQQQYLEFQGPSKSVYVSALSTLGMPKELYSFHIDQLLGLDCEFTVCQMFQFLENSTAQRQIQSAEQYYRMEVKSLGTRIAEKILKTPVDKVNTGNLHLAEDAQAALAELTATDVSYGYYSMSILCLGATRDESNRACEIITGSMKSNGYLLTREVNGLMAAYLTSLPGSSKTALRKYLASSANLSDLVPLRTIASGQPKHALFSSVLGRSVPALMKMPKYSGIPYDFSPHEVDLGHMAIIGGSGAGKTTMMHMVISMHQKYHPCQTFIFDKDHSMMVLTLLLGGKHIDMQTKDSGRIGVNPVRRMLESGDPLALRRWLEVLITAGTKDAKIDPIESQELFSAIKEVQALPKEFWRLGEVYAAVKGRNENLAMRMSPFVDRSDHASDYTKKGPFAEFFDNEDDAFSLTNIVGMETGKLLMTPEIASPFMDYAFYCIEQKLDGNTPTLIYVEEAWYMLSNPVFAEKMDDWLRTFRKKKAYLVFATQALDEIKQMKSVGAFISNVPTRIFLPSMTNSVAANADLYRDIFGLNDAQLDLLSQALPKRDYLIVKGRETHLVEVEVPELVIRINDATSKTNLREVARDMASSNQISWQKKYLSEVLNVH